MGNQSVLCPVCQGVLPASGKESYTPLRGRLIVTNGYCEGGCAEVAEQQAQRQAQMEAQRQRARSQSPSPAPVPMPGPATGPVPVVGAGRAPLRVAR
ncbi:hypothetical protein GCM10022224_031580 [Nonomuraea antimicrobica]|uniref:Uncharacterized protein n=1 Tax=Nonomuraea antimicrobica TaxID=561173 RepID=A0ABP7BN90_9ACTN